MPTSPLPARPERVTALYIGRVGDVIVATPFLRALRRRYPKARLRLVAGWRSREVLPLIPFVDESLVLGRPAELASHARLAWRFLRDPCDLLVDLNSSFSKTSSALARASRAPAKLAFRKPRGPGVFTHELPAPGESEHMAERYARLAEALGAPYEPDLELRLPAADQEEADRLLGPLTSPGERAARIAIHPGNFDRFSFRWPEEKFIALADRLAEDPSVRLFFMGGPGEGPRVEAIARALKRPAPVFPPARLGVAGGMLRRMDLFVCNITGTTHLAAALGVPTFGFYAGYTRAVWRPRGARHGGAASPEWESCREITVEAAYAALRSHLARIRSAA